MMISRRSALGALGSLGALGALRGLGLPASGALTSDEGLPSMREQIRPTRIGVIGAGSLGGTVGRLLVQAGHEVLYSSRHPDALVPMTRRLGARASAGTTRQAAELGPVVLVAVPYAALPGLGRDLRDAWRGKVVLDACNGSPLQDDPVGREALAQGLGLASARHLPGTRLVRAFSAVDASAVAASAGRQNGKLAVPIAGDDREALAAASQLVRDAGCDPLVVGDLAAASRFQRGTPAFRANTTLPELRRLLGMPEGR
jgi:8-hydroxy-5-deazaflavin:NADPH oxidoreductase